MVPQKLSLRGMGKKLSYITCKDKFLTRHVIIMYVKCVPKKFTVKKRLNIIDGGLESSI